MNKKGAGVFVLITGIALVLIALNASFDWFSFDIWGADISLLALVAISVIMAITGYLQRNNVVLLVSLLLILLAINAGAEWFMASVFGLDIVSIALIILGAAFLYYGFSARKGFDHSAGY